MAEMRSGYRGDYVVLALLACSLALNAWLGARVWTRGSAAAVAVAPLASNPSRPEPGLGSAVPPIVCETLDGRPVTLGPGDDRRPLLLYVFTTHCPWCLRNVANINTLAAATPDRFRVAALALDSDVAAITRYVTANGLTPPVYARLSAQTFEAYGFGAVPLTLVISPDGHLLQRWHGAYTGASQREIEDFFNVTLPGLMTSPAAQAGRAAP
jgi:hypothetical protein